MGFASVYLEEKTLFTQKIEEAPAHNTGIIVVVPAYNERGIIRMLDSLSKCREPECRVEVIIVINAPDNASTDSLENNLLAFNEIESWKKTNISCFFRLYCFMVPQYSVAGWGVGLARKTGMDEAVRRFNAINKPEGVILNLDADCTVEENYFEAVFNDFLKYTDRNACSIYFEHPVSGDSYSANIFHCIVLYELHLRYYYQSLAYTGFPYVFHTVGSSLAVKALPYVKAGGMNRRQAGEDFYFIQKLVPSGYFNLNSTTVHPSPRISNRVPFGTGASMGKLESESGSTLLTYNIDAFSELKSFFSLTEPIYECFSGDLGKIYFSIPQALKLFLNETEWTEKMNEIKNNTSNIISFKKRFFDWFNMFKVVKYLNFVHSEPFEKKTVPLAASDLLLKTNSKFRSADPLELLWHYRSLEKN